MITRRGVLRVAVQGLAVGFGSAMAQQPKRKSGTRKKASSNPGPMRADERINDVLAPIRVVEIRTYGGNTVRETDPFPDPEPRTVRAVRP